MNVEENRSNIFEVIIIGAGPAGLATAIQLKRTKIKALILEKHKIGGILKNANLVENYLGFPNGISGIELIKKIEEQLSELNITLHLEEVVEVDYNNQDEIFQVSTQEKTYSSRFLVIASGTKPKKLLNHIPNTIKEYFHYEVYPLLKVERKKVIVIGAGDAAFDQSLSLAKKNDITILNRGVTTQCLPLLFERAKLNNRISHLLNTQVEKFEQANNRIRVICNQKGKEIVLFCDFVLIAIGRIPSIDFISKRLEMGIKELESNKKLFFVGDIKNDIFRQVSIAVGDGVKTAMQIGSIVNTY
ncbi:MAG: NAD(P)/FAD-dependent oxidoreductase [Candidatus Hodarchaeales archaeon]